MTLVPLRVMVAVSPSGGHARFIKFGDSLDKELSYYHGILTAREDTAWWKAKLRAEKPGRENWERAAAVLRDAGWTVQEEPV